MDTITAYLNQILTNDFDKASETINTIVKERVKERFADAKEEVKKNFKNLTSPTPT